MNNKNFNILVYTKFFSELGTYLNLVGLELYIYALTQSGFLTALFLACRLGGTFLSGYWAGYWADHIDRKKIMVLADVLRALTLILMLIVPQHFFIPLIFVLSFLLGLMNNFFTVSFQASLPVVVQDKHVNAANTKINGLNALSIAVGSLLGGIVFELLDYRFLLAMDAVSFMFSAWILSGLELHTQKNIKKEKAAQRVQVQDVLRASPKWVLIFLCIRVLDFFGSAAHNVGFPIFANTVHLNLQAGYVMALIYVTWALGKMLPSWPYLKKVVTGYRQTHGLNLFLWATFVMSASFIAIFFSSHLAVIAGCAFLAGVGDGYSEITYHSYLHQSDDAVRGRVFGLSASLGTLGFGVGLLLCGLWVDVFPLAQVVLVFHGSVASACILAWLWSRKMTLDT